MTLGLIVMGVTITLFAGTSRSRADLERSSRLAENAHVALDLVAEELRHAGFVADLDLSGVSWQLPELCATAVDAIGYSTAPFQLPMPVRGYTAADPEPGCVSERRAGTAMVTLRRLATETTAPADVRDGAFVQVSKCNLDAPRVWRYTVEAGDLSLRNIDCATLADIRRVVMRTYFVADCNECGRDTIPTLKRVELVAGRIVETPLVEGVENLQLEYGFDTDGDGNADVFRATLSGIAGAADNVWTNVVAARVYILARTTDAQPGHTEAAREYDFGEAGALAGPHDAFKRTMLVALVRMPNVAGRRELP